ncbi:N-6 DNA methylase [Streptomyces sp. NPDC006195]|uniref:N-6 DNA methylase n=1 Tax=unclassified Streptomyces TaxID=2593676 RepID=UPI0033B0EDD4
MTSEQSREGRLVSRAEIAALAGVRRSAVTNWERRHAAFPEALRAGEAEFFRLTDIIRWLDTRQVPNRDRRVSEPEMVTYGDRIRASLKRGQASSSSGEASRTSLDSGSERARYLSRESLAELLELSMMQRWGARSPAGYLPLPICLTFLKWAGPERYTALERLASSRPPLELRRFLQKAGEEADELLRKHGVVPAMKAALHRLAPERDADAAQMLSLVDGLDRGAFRDLLDAFAKDVALGSREAFTPRGVVDLLSGISVTEGSVRRINDPYPRGGELLAAAVAASGDASPPVVRAEAPNDSMLRMTAMNLMIHGVVPQLNAKVGAPWLTTARDHRAGADFILTNPPFNAESGKTGSIRWRYGTPPPSNDNFAWLQHVLSMLRPGGRAGVIMADNAAVSDQPKERAIRQAMVEDGVVECVVALPSHLFAGTTVSACIWFLTTPSTRTEVHFINARRAGKMASRTRRELQPDDVRLLRQIHRSLREGTTLPDDVRVLGRSVSVQEIKKRGHSLSPVDYVSVGTHAVATPADVAASREELLGAQGSASSLDSTTQSLWGQGTAFGHIRQRPSHGWPRRLLGDLCKVQAGPSPSLLNPKMFSRGGEVPVVLPKHLRNRRISAIEESRVSDRDARRLERFLLSEGDILCTRTGTVGPSAVVGAAEAGCLYIGNLLRLHAFEPDTDSRFVLAFLSLPEVQAWIKDRAEMTTVASIKTKAMQQLPVLLPPIEEQRRIGDLLCALDSQIRAHHQVVAAAERAHGELATLLMGGALSSDEQTPAPDAMAAEPSSLGTDHHTPKGNACE